jgi:hypothetical protein
MVYRREGREKMVRTRSHTTPTHKARWSSARERLGHLDCRGDRSGRSDRLVVLVLFLDRHLLVFLVSRVCLLIEKSV